MKASEIQPNERDHGWANHETFMIVLHLDNDAGLQAERRAMMARGVAVHAVHGEAVGSPVGFIADQLREWVEGLRESVFYPEGGFNPTRESVRSMVGDVGSLWRVDWREVAAHYWAELVDEGVAS